MRALLILLVVALLMGLAGWVSVDHSSNRTSINLETDEIQSDTQRAAENAIESGARAIVGEEGETLDADPTPAQPVPIDHEPVTTAPTETPVTSPVVTP